MLIAAIIILGSGAALVALGLLAVSVAPQGYEDHTGFHFGSEHSSSSQSQPEHFGALLEAKATA